VKILNKLVVLGKCSSRTTCELGKSDFEGMMTGKGGQKRIDIDLSPYHDSLHSRAVHLA